MLSDSLQCSFYCCYFYFTETWDNFCKHMQAHTSPVATLTMLHLSDKTSQDLSFPVLLTIIFIVIINNYYSTDVMFKWCPSDLDVASRKVVWKESKVQEGYTDHSKNEKGVWSDWQERKEEISCNLDWVPSPQALNIFSSLWETGTLHCQGIFSFAFPEGGREEGSEWEGGRDAC